MKNTILLLLIISLLASCSGPKYPEFRGIANPKILSLSMKNVVVETDIIMNNPNGFEIEMTGMDVNIYANDVLVGHTNQTKSSMIGANKNFNVPISFDFSPKKVLNLGNLGGLLNAIGNKVVDLKYEGSVSVKVANKIIAIPFTYEDKLPLKKEDPSS